MGNSKKVIITKEVMTMLLGLLIGLAVGAVGGFLFARNSKKQSAAVVQKYEATVAELKEQLTKLKQS